MNKIQKTLLEYENIIASNNSIRSGQDSTSITLFEQMGYPFLESSSLIFLAQPCQHFQIDLKRGFRFKNGNFGVCNPVIVLNIILLSVPKQKWHVALVVFN